MKISTWLMVIMIYDFAYGTNTDEINEINSTDTNQLPYSFAVFGDSRDGNDVLKRLIDSIRFEKSIVFGINNGDLVPNGKSEDFDTYKRIVNQASKPIISIIGNHDRVRYGSGGSYNYKNAFGETDFAFSFRSSYFIILDNSSLTGPTPKQWQWLNHELKKSLKFDNRFVLMHVPLYDPRKGKYAKGHSLKSLKDAHQLNALLDKYPITMLFASHIHSYFHGRWHDTPYIITGGAGAPLKSGGFYHYIKVTVDKHNVKYKVVKIKKR